MCSITVFVFKANGQVKSPRVPEILGGSTTRIQIGVYLGVRTCELFLCFVAIVRVRVYYVDFFVFFVLCHW